MVKDFIYTNGVIAVRESNLLKDKILKLCEANADEAFRVISESGFGKGAEISSVYDYERLVAADERNIDEFIREYSPNAAEMQYLLSPRDFHNAKALVKAEYLRLDIEKLLAPDGLYPAQELLICIRENNFKGLNQELADAIVAAKSLLEENASGAEVGVIFEKATFEHLARSCAKHSLLKKFIALKADMTNVLTALRSSDTEYAEKCFVGGGKSRESLLLTLFNEDKEKVISGFKNTDCYELVKHCIEAKQANLPLTQAEKIFESFEAEFFKVKQYELKRDQPFLYYVFRRRAENANVRILFACLLAGMREADIKKRLRAF